jgi:hypothetical protein
MPLLRGAILVGSATVLTAWLLAETIAPSRPIATPAVRTSAVSTTGSDREGVSPTAQLHARLEKMRVSPAIRRDPFRFATPAPAAAAARRQSVPSDPPASIEPSTRPEIRLLGIAEDSRDGTIVRNAIISSSNQLYLVGEGEQLALRFLVKRIDEKAVDIEDLAEGATFQITLK